MSYVDAIQNPSTEGHSQPILFARVKTITCIAQDPEKNNRIEDIMKELIDHDLGPDVITRVTKKQPHGEFALTMPNTEARDRVKQLLEAAIQAGSFRYDIKAENQVNNEQFIVITGFPEEMKLEAIQAYMTQYLIQPIAQILKHPQYGFEIGEIRLVHKGLRKPLGKRVWLGPGISALIKETSIAPWDDCTPTCSNCMERGHLYITCSNPQRCRLCRKSGHFAKECSKCACCKKWGHKEEECYFNPQRKKPPTHHQKQKITTDTIKETIKNIMEKKNARNKSTDDDTEETENITQYETEEEEEVMTQSSTEEEDGSDEGTDNDKENKNENKQDNENTTDETDSDKESEDESEEDEKMEVEKSNRGKKRPANSPHRGKDKITKNKEGNTDCKVTSNSPSN